MVRKGFCILTDTMQNDDTLARLHVAVSFDLSTSYDILDTVTDFDLGSN